MAGEYEIDAGGNRGSLFVIDSDSGECFVDFEAAGVSESRSTLECFRQRILSTE